MCATIKCPHLSLWVLVILSVFLLAGCTTVENDGLATPPAGTEITISTGTQGVFRQLAIGLRSTGRESYLDAEGKKKSRLIAGLAMSISGDDRVSNIGANVGQTIEFGGYTLYVREISAGGIALAPGGSTGHVSLIIQETPGEQ